MRLRMIRVVTGQRFIVTADPVCDAVTITHERSRWTQWRTAQELARYGLDPLLKRMALRYKNQSVKK